MRKKVKKAEGVVKNKTKIKKACKIAATVLASSIFLTGTTVALQNVNNVKLPNEKQIEYTVENFDADERYISIRNNDNIDYSTYDFVNSAEIRRFIIKNNENLKVFADESVSEKNYTAIKESLAYINGLFEIINPNYKFNLTTEKKLGDYFNSNLITVSENNEQSFAGIARIKGLSTFSNFGKKQYVNNITLNKDYAENNEVSTLRTVFIHEFLHLLGFADTYTIDSFDTSTIMSGAESIKTSKILSNNDLKLLLALYSDNSNENQTKFEQLLTYNKSSFDYFNQNFYEELKIGVKNFLIENGCDVDDNFEITTPKLDENNFYVSNSENTNLLCLNKSNSLAKIKVSKFNNILNKKNEVSSVEKNINNSCNSLESLIFELSFPKENGYNCILNCGKYSLLISSSSLKNLNIENNQFITILKNVSEDEFLNICNQNRTKTLDVEQILS